MFNKHFIKKKTDIYYNIDHKIAYRMVIRTLVIHWFNARTCWRRIFPRQFTVVVMQVPPSICGSAQQMFIFADVAREFS